MSGWYTDAGLMDNTALKYFMNNKLLCRTPKVENFLDEENAEKTIVVGPKGLGKTLLLRLKRRILQSRENSAVFLPQNKPCDKLPGAAGSLDKEKLNRLADDSHWLKIWLVSFAIPIIAHYKFHDSDVTDEIIEGELDYLDKNLTSTCLKRLIGNKDGRGKLRLVMPSYCITNILNQNRSEYSKIEHDSEFLLHELSAINRVYRIFIDNIDEYFLNYLKAHRDQGGYELWYKAQIGAISAAQHIRGQNHHMRVYCAIRKEALDFGLDNELATQIRSSCVNLSYEIDDLKQIIEKNVSVEPTDNLYRTDDADDDNLEAWVGSKNLKIPHEATGQDENILDYIVRHTFGRPRDVIEIGKSISELDLEHRNLDRIREIVNTQSTALLKQYISECSSHETYLNYDCLCETIYTNSIKRSDLQEFDRRYHALRAESKYSGQKRSIIEILWKIGLLGSVTNKHGITSLKQVFRPVGGVVEENNIQLPNSNIFVFHPALTEMQMRSDEYLDNRNLHNIIGHQHPWVVGNNKVFIIMADIVGSSDLEQSDLNYTSDSIVQILENSSMGYISRVDGDAFLVTSRNLKFVMDCILKIHDQMKTRHSAELRFSGTYRPILGYSERRAAEIFRGNHLAIRDTKRILDNGKTKPSQLLCDGALFEEFCAYPGLKENFEHRCSDISKESEAEEMNDLYAIKIHLLTQ